MRAAGGHRHGSLGGASDLLASEVGTVADGRGVGRGGGTRPQRRATARPWMAGPGSALATHPVDPTRVRRIVAAPANLR
jgi:hypothetical protein